jgi:hypothetical protein
MIDPILSLCFGLHSNPGVYALLLGSGVSRAAQIPTGWEIISDLTRKVARLRKEDCEPDPLEWYRKAFKKKPSYSEIIDQIAKTQTERQKLLKAYFEPTEDEREDGAKQPTAAHRSIANLVAGGYVRVIITTNFDRLLETAMADVGVVPTVIKAPDDVKGALPLIHSRCTIIKVHGDYIDTRIKNTLEELSSYNKGINKLLDRVFDEFGLIVCGWSADWDEALRTAITRFENRRFTMYWASYGDLSLNAQDLVTHRSGQIIPITSADSFFDDILEKTTALAEFERPHPLSAQVAVLTAKKYLSEDKYSIRLHDLLTDEANRVSAEINSSFYSPQPPYSRVALNQRIERYEASIDILLPVAIQVAYWGSSKHIKMLQNTLQIIGTPTNRCGGTTIWIKLFLYPASLIFYAICIAMIATNKFDLLYILFYEKIKPIIGGLIGNVDIAAVNLSIYNIIEHEMCKDIEGFQGNEAVAFSQILIQKLRGSFNNTIPVNSDYEFIFDKCEYLLALIHIYHIDYRPLAKRDLAYLGSVYYRRENFISIQKQFNNVDNNSDILKAGFFGGSWERLNDVHDRLKEITFTCQ